MPGRVLGLNRNDAIPPIETALSCAALLWSTLDRALAVLPAVLVIAAINALNEEVIFRAGPVAALDGVLGRRELVLLVVALFAIPHYFGVPFGLAGVAMAAVFAWWTTKALLETRGLFWPWVIHLVQDVLIFTFILAGAPA